VGLTSRTSRVLAAALVCTSALIGAPAGAAAAGGAPRVVASIPPLHSLVAGVMDGVAKPVLLIPGGASPHGASLRPSQARALATADVVFWIGGGLEIVLEKPLAALAGAARTVAVSAQPGIARLPLRQGGAWVAHDGEAQDGEAHNGEVGADKAVGTRDRHEPPGDYNPHVWLDPANARRIIEIAAAALSEADPGNAAAYAENGARLRRELEALDQELADMLAPVRSAPYVVLHDAYPYLERRYGLNAVGAVSLNPEVPPGARRLVELRRRIAGLGAVCLFAEPQFRPALLESLIRDTGARAGVLDPLGAALEPGARAYFRLMRGLARALAECLSGAG
jgi:zinc transport system substrate-binding protein